MDNTTPLDDVTDTSLPEEDDDRVYFVPYRVLKSEFVVRWWKEAQKGSVVSEDDENNRGGILYTARSSSNSYVAVKFINQYFNSDIVFNLHREDESRQNGSMEEGVSGRDYALVSGEMWLKALRWHSDSNAVAKDAGNNTTVEEDTAEVYPLQLRLSVLRETNLLTVKISKKENTVELYKRACKIFNVEYEVLRIWDFSGRTTLFSVIDVNKFPKDCRRQSDQESLAIDLAVEIFLELQVYGLSDFTKSREGKKDDSASQQTKMSVFSSGVSFMNNGSTGNMESCLFLSNSSAPSTAGSLGLTGLQNLGNTCFMNSALQCLAHTPKLTDYFLGDYNREINPDNPLGMNGELALAFGDLIRKLWAPGAAPVAARLFKSKLAHFAPQFSGFNQHDSQELLAFLLDGLHEDLNRVKCKPYIEAKDADGRPDEEVADEYWRNHLARNDSIIVDVCHGQYRSTLVCPACSKVSVTFDPLMYLSLPLPSTTMRSMTVTVLSSDGCSQPSQHTVVVPKYGKCKDLIQALSNACCLKNDETLLVAEIYNHRVIRYLEEPSDSLTLIRDDDRLVAYRLPKDVEKSPLVVFTHERIEKQFIYGKVSSYSKGFGIPLVARLCKLVNGSDIHNLFQKLLTPYIKPSAAALDVHDSNGEITSDEVAEMEDVPEIEDVPEMEDAPEMEDVRDSSGDVANKVEDNPDSDIEVEFYLTNDKGMKIKDSKMEMDEEISVTEITGRLNLHVNWSDKLIERYDTQHLSSLPEIFKSGFFAKRPQESVSLYSCLEAFLKEEPLGPEDMWYCPGCKEPRQASKKLDLWRLPEILIIHLKRFSYSRFMKNKLDSFVDFSIDDLDLSTYIACINNQSSCRYRLFAVSNHYGSMGGGHYTAFVFHGGNQWFDFDDSRVSPINVDKIKTSAAYVLFYRRIQDD
ncbi:hypothetical protein IFM89_000386 [Coptis chinensis]|uniref:Ubiquitin carboxyl-terminal hydrolase n=1 Tax=Coptis chinensis TaxID=261450 RepID=A0A835HEM8_9MAGN|nr:hypothetical protein IFM89_000386 [Coptis chinensis]